MVMLTDVGFDSNLVSTHLLQERHLICNQFAQPMAYTRYADFRYRPTNRVSSRSKQLIALAGAIIIGMIISGAVNAIPSSKPVNLSTKVSAPIESIKK